MVFSNSVYLLTCFILYAVIGWVYEVVYYGVLEGKIRNRSFLIGTYSFSFALAMLLVLSIHQYFKDSVLFFILSFFLILGSLLFMLLIIRVLFKIDLFGNLRHNNQRRSLLMIFAYTGGMYFVQLLLLYHFQPLLESFLQQIPLSTLRFLSSFILILLITDLLYSMKYYAELSYGLRSLQEYLNNNDLITEEFDEGQLANLYAVLKDEESEILNSRSRNRFMLRILRTYPLISFSAVDNRTNILLERIWTYNDLQITVKPKKREKLSETRKWREYYGNLSYYHLILIFTLASLIGFVMETIICVLQRGHIESRAGVIYGPFTEIYGFGAVIMVLLLLPLSQRGFIWTFLGGALIGGGFEVICSWLQEKTFNSVSWQYAYQRTSILGGRTSLYIMFCWGLLAVLFVKYIYPLLMKLINRIPLLQSRFVATSLTVFFIFNLSISAIAVFRWSERLQELPPSNKLETFLDEHYDNNFMADIFPNMHFLEFDSK